MEGLYLAAGGCISEGLWRVCLLSPATIEEAIILLSGMSISVLAILFRYFTWEVCHCRHALLKGSEKTTEYH